METSAIDYRERYTKWLYFTMAGLFFIFALLCLIALPVEAKTTVNSTLYVTHVTKDSISWNYTYLTANRPIGASLDGVSIEGWQTDLVYNYTASELEPNTTHEFCIFGSASSNCEKGTTLSDNTDLTKIAYEYIWAVLCCILIVTGIYIKRQEPTLAAGLISFIGLGIVGNNLIGQIIYVLLLVVSFYISFED